jgi:hypothetical protein
MKLPLHTVVAFKTNQPIMASSYQPEATLEVKNHYNFSSTMVKVGAHMH